MKCPSCGEALDRPFSECPFCASKLDIQSDDPQWRRAGEAPLDLPRGRMGAGGRTLLMLVPLALFLIAAFWITSTSRARRAEMDASHERAVREMKERFNDSSVACTFCSGKKTLACPSCGNARRASCEFCGGAGRIPCPNCK